LLLAKKFGCAKFPGKPWVVAIITDYQAVDRFIVHLKLRFDAEKPPPECAFRDLFMVADSPVEYFS